MASSCHSDFARHIRSPFFAGFNLKQTLLSVLVAPLLYCIAFAETRFGAMKAIKGDERE